MAPQSMNVLPEILSETQRRLQVSYFNGVNPRSKKLICSFLPRVKYTVFGQNLQFYLSRGMKLRKVHRGIKFTGLPYLAGYIKHNTEMRQANRDDETKKNFVLRTNRVWRRNLNKNFLVPPFKNICWGTPSEKICLLNSYIHYTYYLCCRYTLFYI